MYLVSFDSREEIKKTISRTALVLDFNTFRDVSRIYYDTLKLAHMKLKRKIKLSEKKRKTYSLARKDIAKAINVLTHFHSNDKYTQFDENSPLAGCYHPNFSISDAWKYCGEYLLGTTNDNFNVSVKFDENFLKCLYKDERGNHVIQDEYYIPSRGKRLPMVKHSIQTTKCIFQRIDDKDYLERMYIHRYKDFNQHEYYFVVIVKKYRKDLTNSPFYAKTAFAIFKYNGLLRRIEKYEPVKLSVNI